MQKGSRSMERFWLADLGSAQKNAEGRLLILGAGTAGVHRQWVMRQERRTPDYTTSWKDMPLVTA